MEHTRLVASLVRGLLSQLEAFESHHGHTCTVAELHALDELRENLQHVFPELDTRLPKPPESETSMASPRVVPIKPRRSSSGGLQ
jgi:hypothetical protein